MFLAAATETTEKAALFSKFQAWDLFMLAFTIIIAWSVVRTITAKEKNKLAIVFSIVSLCVFLYCDYLMVLNWFNKL